MDLAEQTSLDIVDISALFGPPGMARDATDAALWTGLRRTGSVVITGYPDADKVDGRARIGLKVFDLPQDMQRTLYTKRLNPGNTNLYRGFWALTPNRRLQNDFYDVGPETPGTGPDLPGIDFLTEPTPWPDPEPEPGWRQTVQAHFDHLNGVAMAMIASIGRSAGFDDAVIAERFDGTNSTLRFLHYPAGAVTPMEAEDGALLSAVRHTDSSGLSLLWQDTTGLQAEGQDGIFRNIPRMENAISVHVGDVMTQMTKGVVPATPHRVLHTGDASRHSVGFFLEPALSAPVTPADHPVGKPAVQDTYAFQLLRTLSSRVEWDGIAKDPAEAL
ncbi:2OG-Fe(II) oxygenase family protein [Chachezhania antarctica]|uniref:2OG-Fe(II) oxygenase family protein n=1 Tax=Chachezhania antarctica TaxID=2340860 RepID=UPI000EAC00DF|nr:2OG-Fe(II) oxygenase family protein [Chachezhania antarctica]